MRHDPLLFFFAGFMVGVLTAAFISVSPYLLITVGAIAISCGGVACISRASLKNRVALSLTALTCLSMVIGVMRFTLSTVTYNTVSLDQYQNQQLRFEGNVLSVPEIKSTSKRFVFRTKSINAENAQANLLVTVGMYADVRYGDTLLLTGGIEVPEIIESEDGRDFDYKAYLEMQNIHYLMKRPAIQVLARDAGNPLMTFLYGVRQKSVVTMQRLFSETESALLAGILLGVKSGLGEELETDFRRVGLIHIVVLSGANITIIASAILSSLSFMPRTNAFATAAVAMILFALLVGLSATVMRATIMALLALFAQGVRREYRVVRALSVALFLMVMLNPRILVFDPSFQLSFLATLALIYVTPLLEKPLSYIPESFSLREFVTTTVATQLFVTPYIVYLMGDISIISVIVNVLVLPFIPLTMLTGFLSVVAAFIHDVMAIPFVWITHVLMSYELAVVSWFSDLSFAAIHVSAVSFVWVLVIYGIYVWIFRWYYKKSPEIIR